MFLRPLRYGVVNFRDNFWRINCLSECLDKLSFRIHQVNEYRVVDEVVTVWVGIRRRREIYTVGFTDCLRGLVRSNQADERFVEVGQVLTNSGAGVSSWVNGDEDWLEYRTVFFL